MRKALFSGSLSIPNRRGERKERKRNRFDSAKMVRKCTHHGGRRRTTAGRPYNQGGRIMIRPYTYLVYTVVGNTPCGVPRRLPLSPTGDTSLKEGGRILPSSMRRVPPMRREEADDRRPSLQSGRANRKSFCRGCRLRHSLQEKAQRGHSSKRSSPLFDARSDKRRRPAYCHNLPFVDIGSAFVKYV